MLIPSQNHRTEERGEYGLYIDGIRLRGQSGAFAIFRLKPPNHLERTVRLDHTESKMSKHEYTLHYHGGIPGRGEFVRLAFEYTGTPYRVRFPSVFTADSLTPFYPTG